MSTPYVNASHYSGSSQPVIVQGQIVGNSSSSRPIPATGDFSQALNVNDGNYSQYANDPTIKGEPQPKQCRDFVWGLLFYLHLGGIAACTAIYAPLAAQEVGQDYTNGAQRRFLEDGSEDFTLDMDAIMYILICAGLAGCVLSSLSMLFMMKFAEGLIKIALVWNIVVALIMAIAAIAGGVPQMALVFGVGALFSAYWCYVVWPKIPFAAINLITATTAVRENIGLAFFAYLNLSLTFLWTFWWAIAFVSTTFILGECAADGSCQNDVNIGIVFLFLVSFFWTSQVLKNITHTTVAGTVGTFWFVPHEASGCCSQGVRDSYVRSITTSFGSICLGSLIVAIIQAVKEILHSMREQNDSILVCLADCILGLIESLAEYFNQWAFVYVGLYGYSFMEAGKNVMTLFRTRGWTSIIADMLVDTVLLMVSLGVGVLTGVVGVIVGSIVQQDSATLAAAFMVGMAIGFVLCSTFFSLISSAVNATVVLYAEAPAEFQANHPQLSGQMRAAWRKAYPNEFQY